MLLTRLPSSWLVKDLDPSELQECAGLCSSRPILKMLVWKLRC